MVKGLGNEYGGSWTIFSSLQNETKQSKKNCQIVFHKHILAILLKFGMLDAEGRGHMQCKNLSKGAWSYTYA